MFRWKKRDEGFEWQQYVRTTIKLRREARREQAERMGRQAAEGAAAVGSAAGAAARAGARGVVAGLRLAAVQGTDVAVAFVGLVGLWLGRAARGVRHGLAPVGDVAGRAGVAGPLTLAGSIALGAGLVRLIVGHGRLDTETVAALAIGVGCLLLAIGPALWLGHSRMAAGEMGAWLGRFVSGAGRRTAAAIAAVIVVGLGLAASGWLPSSLTAPSLPSLPFVGAARVVEGRAIVLEGDLIRIGESTVRLAGIEPPAASQRCQRASGRSWRCGEAARDALQKSVKGQGVRCETGRPDSLGIAAGRCLVGQSDLAAALLKDGHVFAAAGAEKGYAALEDEARKARSGVWGAARPERPGEWQARVWAEAKERAPQGCPIKGQVARGERIYVVPSAERYERVRVNERRGERWFCTEAEAEAAGLRKAGRG